MRSMLRQDTEYSKLVGIIITVALLTLALIATPVMGLGDDPSIDTVLNDSDYNNTGEIGFNDSATFEIELTDINDSEVSSLDGSFLDSC